MEGDDDDVQHGDVDRGRGVIGVGCHIVTKDHRREDENVLEVIKRKRVYVCMSSS